MEILIFLAGFFTGGFIFSMFYEEIDNKVYEITIKRRGVDETQ